MQKECSKYGFDIFLVEGFRSIERQNELYAQRPKVTNAKGGASMHNYGVAIDYAFRGNETYPPANSCKWFFVNTIAKSLGFYSYGLEDNFDYGHIQLMLGYSESDFRNNKINYEQYR